MDRTNCLVIDMYIQPLLCLFVSRRFLLPAVCIFVLWRVQHLVTCTKESHDARPRKETPCAAAVCSVLLLQLAQRGVLLLQVLNSGHNGPVLLMLLLGVGCSLSAHDNTVADAAAAGQYTPTHVHTHTQFPSQTRSLIHLHCKHTLSLSFVCSLSYLLSFACTVSILDVPMFAILPFLQTHTQQVHQLLAEWVNYYSNQFIFI